MTTAPPLNRSSAPPPVPSVDGLANDRFGFARSLIMLSEPTGSAAEATRALRTHLMAQHIREGRRALALCAVSQGVGCSFVAANLAVALAQIGVKTLLIDANLRQPSVDALFVSAAQTSGLAQCLASEDQNFGRHIEVEVLENLSVMFSGGQPANPQELLASDRFGALMDFCLREFEVTLVDTPAANSCADARRVSTVTGYSLIVARRNVTYVDDIKTLASQLVADHARVIGTVLNNA
jgi:protein-tyrosine kinase